MRNPLSRNQPAASPRAKSNRVQLLEDPTVLSYKRMFFRHDCGLPTSGLSNVEGSVVGRSEPDTIPKIPRPPAGGWIDIVTFDPSGQTCVAKNQKGIIHTGKRIDP